MAQEHWKDEPDEHDYPAAHDYLTLVLDEDNTDATVQALRRATIMRRKAKDLLRASGLTILDGTNVHVAKDLAKVHDGKLLSPVLLVRGRAGAEIPLIVADGYHRICASYHLDEDADIPCKLVDFPA